MQTTAAMTPRDRLLTTIRGSRADRVPLVLEKFQCAWPQQAHDPGCRQIAERVAEQTNFWVEAPAEVNRYLVTDPRCMTKAARKDGDGNMTVLEQIDTPKGPLTAAVGRNAITDTDWTIKYPVESPADIEKIRSCPWDVPPGVARPDLTDLPPQFDQRGVVCTRISSPCVCVGGMMSYETFLELCGTEPTLVRELTAICMDRILRILDVVLADGNVDYVWMGGCEWLTPPMASPQLYDQLVQAFEAPIIERIHAAGAVSHVHCHGNIRSTLERVIARGGDFFEPCEPPPDGDITFADAKAAAAGRITLGGNIEARILENEGVRAVEGAVRAAFDGGKDRMVLQTTAGPLSTMTANAVANYHRMIDVWEELSPIA